MMARTCNELDTADECSILFPEERPPKKEKGLKKTERKASSGGNSSLSPASNNKEPAFTWSNKSAAQICSLNEHKYMWMLLLIFMVPSVSGANEKDPCMSNPCANGSCTRLIYETYSCTCAGGYAGVNCEQDINECESNPCQSGGTCVDGLASYTCNCAKGYNGAICQNNINECASNPCQNGGTCIDGLDEYTCNCAKGYKGANCEIATFKQESPGYINIAPNETIVVTKISPAPEHGSVIHFVARSGNDPGSYECTPAFSANHQNCKIVVGFKNECKGLRIAENASYSYMYLAIDGSDLTDDVTSYCIFLEVPARNFLYYLVVSKKQDQDIAQQEFPRNMTIAPNETTDATEPVPIPDPDTTDWKLAFNIVVPLLVILIVIAIFLVIAIKKNFPYMPRIRAWWEKESMRRVPVRTSDPDPDPNATLREDLEMSNGHAA